MNAVLLAIVAGFGTTMSLIVAIGAQNAFVLRQGIRGESVGTVVAICIVSDMILIALGVGGVGAMVSALPSAITTIRLVGAVFLIGYGAFAARRAFRPAALHASTTPAGSPRRAAVTCLSMTWLNPHVYLDTVLLLGTVAIGHGALRWDFGIGAATASLCWFTALGFGARLLSGFFARPTSWRILDALVAATMITIGIRLAI